MSDIKLVGLMTGTFGSLYSTVIAGGAETILNLSIEPVAVAGASISIGLGIIALDEYLERKTAEWNKEHNWERYKDKRDLLRTMKTLQVEPLTVGLEATKPIETDNNEVELLLDEEDIEDIDNIQENVIEEKYP